MDIIKRRQFREAVQESVKEELKDSVSRIGRGDMTEARAKTAIRNLMRLYEAEIGRDSDEDGGYSYAVSWLKTMIKDEQFIEMVMSWRGY